MENSLTELFFFRNYRARSKRSKSTFPPTSHKRLGRKSSLRTDDETSLARRPPCQAQIFWLPQVSQADEQRKVSGSVNYETIYVVSHYGALIGLKLFSFFFFVKFFNTFHCYFEKQLWFDCHVAKSVTFPWIWSKPRGNWIRRASKWFCGVVLQLAAMKSKKCVPHVQHDYFRRNDGMRLNVRVMMVAW